MTSLFAVRITGDTSEFEKSLHKARLASFRFIWRIRCRAGVVTISCRPAIYLHPKKRTTDDK